MAERIALYLRYYAARRPVEYHGAIPLVLVVFEDALAAGHFRRVAWEETDLSRISVPLFVSDGEQLEREGLFGRSWRTVDSARPTAAFDSAGEIIRPAATNRAAQSHAPGRQ
ncbi:MAG: hypothetical protein OXD50_04175 [Chloroflexi bacterium]|nr:hypothetical protein [Chloroflexota bacterium]